MLKLVKKLISQILSSILGIYLSVRFIPGVKINIFENSEFLGIKITSFWQVLLIIGTFLGLVNFFVKPILKIISLPLRILTLGLSSVLINLLIVWSVSLLFNELVFVNFSALFWTTIIVSFLNSIVALIL